MRTSLAPHVGKIVLIKGWVNSWKFPEDSDYFRLSIKNPIIKESDKNIHFDNQNILSTEDHINIFLLRDRYESFRHEYSRLDVVYLSGKVIQYIRSNGTQDYGVDLLETDRVVDRFNDFLDEGRELLQITQEKGYPTQRILNYMRHSLIPRTYVLEKDLKELGDLFPAFSITYQGMMNMLLDQRQQMKSALEIMQTALESPIYRYRIRKIKHKNKVKELKKNKGFGYSLTQ